MPQISNMVIGAEDWLSENGQLMAEYRMNGLLPLARTPAYQRGSLPRRTQLTSSSVVERHC